MVSDGNGRIKLSVGNWLGLLGVTVTSVTAVVGSHYQLAISVHDDIAKISSSVESNTILINVNKEAIRDNRSDIKTLHLGNQ